MPSDRQDPVSSAETDGGPLYRVERVNDPSGNWRVVGPNGVVDAYRVEAEAQSRANQLNEDVAEESEDDY